MKKEAKELLKDKKKIDCCWENIDKPKYISRAYWVCPVCGKDISLMYCLYMEAIEKGKKFTDEYHIKNKAMTNP